MTTPDLPQGQAQIIWPATPIDKFDRLNETVSHDQHPKDHNDLANAVNAILMVLGQQPYGPSDTLTAELVRLQAGITQANNAAIDAAVAAQQALIEIHDLPPAQLQHVVYQQGQSADVWVVQHNLGYDPVIAVLDQNNVRILGFDLTYASDHNSMTLRFSQAITGRVLLAN